MACIREYMPCIRPSPLGRRPEGFGEGVELGERHFEAHPGALGVARGDELRAFMPARLEVLRERREGLLLGGRRGEPTRALPRRLGAGAAELLRTVAQLLRA